MPFYTVETTYHLPIYKHVTIEAASPADAVRRALEDDDWEDSSEAYDDSGPTYITGIWAGEDAAYTGRALKMPKGVPTSHEEASQA